VLGFLVGEALRDLRRAGRVAVSAVVLITLSLGALGAFWLVSSNLDRAVAQWRHRVRIVAYLKREPAAADAAARIPNCWAKARAFRGLHTRISRNVRTRRSASRWLRA